MSTNRDLIGMQLSYDINKLVPRAFKNAKTVSNDSSLGFVKEMCYYRHLGFDAPLDEVGPLVASRISWVVQYFEKGDTRDQNGGWFYPLSRGMLLCLLTGRKEDLCKISQWATPKKKPEYKGPLADEIQQLYLVLASQFQVNPDKGFDRLLSKLRECRKRNIKPLVNALHAVVSRDQTLFAGAIKKCVEQHSKQPKPAPDAYFMEDWFPQHANTVFLAGLELGLNDPSYAPEIAAYLMTPESVGLRPSS